VTPGTFTLTLGSTEVPAPTPLPRSFVKTLGLASAFVLGHVLEVQAVVTYVPGPGVAGGAVQTVQATVDLVAVVDGAWF